MMKNTQQSNLHHPNGFVWGALISMKHLFPVLLVLLAMVRVDAAPRPNIVFILADDLGYMDVSGYAKHTLGVPPSNQFYETPHIDQLMKEGLSFSRAYASQLCSPTRASLLTGRYASKLGFTTASWHGMPTYHMEGQTAPEGLHSQEAIYHFDTIEQQQAWKNGGTMTAL